MKWSDLPRSQVPTPSGVLVVDKPAGVTSHDVVGAIRRLSGIRKVGHAGTLDPMATGVLTIGIGHATRLLTYMTSERKRYIATIAFGGATSSADADGDFLYETTGLKGAFAQFAQFAQQYECCSATENNTEGSSIDFQYSAKLLKADVRANVNFEASNAKKDATKSEALEVEVVRHIDHAITDFRGVIMQVPPAVSAKRINGERAYDLAREGKEVELAAQQVTVFSYSRTSEPRVICADGVPLVEVDVAVECSAGTYIRSLARDLGEKLDMGAHLRMLRRTNVGEFDVNDAYTIEQLSDVITHGDSLPVVPLVDAASRLMAVAHVNNDQVHALRHGQFITLDEHPDSYPVALIHEGNILDDLIDNTRDNVPCMRELVAIGKQRGRKTAPSVVFPPTFI